MSCCHRSSTGGPKAPSTGQTLGVVALLCHEANSCTSFWATGWRGGHVSKRTALARLNNSVALGGSTRGERLDVLDGLGLAEDFPDVSLLELLEGSEPVLTGGPQGATLLEDLAIFGNDTGNDIAVVPDQAKLDFLIGLSSALQNADDSLTQVAMRRGDADPLVPILESLTDDPDLLRRVIDEVSTSAPPRVRWLQDPKPAEPFSQVRSRLIAAAKDAGIADLFALDGVTTDSSASLIRVDVGGDGQFGILIESLTTIDCDQAPDVDGKPVTAQVVAESKLMQPEHWPDCHGFWQSMDILDPEGDWPEEVAAALRAAKGDGTLIHEKVSLDKDRNGDMLPLTVLRFDQDRRDAADPFPFRQRYCLVRDRVILDHLAQLDYETPTKPQPLVLDDGAIIVRDNAAEKTIEIRITKTLLYGKSTPIDLQNRGQTVAALLAEWGWGDQTADFLSNCIFR